MSFLRHTTNINVYNEIMTFYISIYVNKLKDKHYEEINFSEMSLLWLFKPTFCFIILNTHNLDIS